MVIPRVEIRIALLEEALPNINRARELMRQAYPHLDESRYVQLHAADTLISQITDQIRFLKELEHGP